MEPKSKPKSEIISNNPDCCSECLRFEKFDKKCFYFWEGKKQCTMHVTELDDPSLKQEGNP